MVTTRSWMELSPRTRRLITMLGVVEVALLVAAQVDLARRPPELVAGSKAGWRLITLINLIGPISYFVRGRRKAGVA